MNTKGAAVAHDQLLLAPAQAAELRRLEDAAKLKFQLSYWPVKRGSFSLASAGIRDYSNGILFDDLGHRCGTLDYDKAQGFIDVRVLRGLADYTVRYTSTPIGLRVSGA